MTDTTTVTTTAVANTWTFFGLTVDQWLSNARSVFKFAAGALVALGVTDAITADALTNDIISFAGAASGLIGIVWSMTHHQPATTVTAVTTQTPSK